VRALILKAVTTQTVTLIAAIIALIGSLLTLLIGTRLTLLRERRQLLWSKELDRFFTLEELAGELAQDLASYRSLDAATIAPRMEELHRAAGRFARYDQVRRSILQLHNTLGRMFVAKRDSSDEERELRGELDTHLKQLLNACDEITKRQKLL
jgi:hypothetical protein